MKNNSLLIRLVVAAVVVAAGWGIYHSRTSAIGSDLPTADAEGWFLPHLRESLNEVVRIRMTQGDQVLEAKKAGEQWIAPDLAGYPLQFERVREFLLQAASLKDAERKTANPARHADLGLAVEGEPGATLLEIWTAEGDPAVAVFLGRNRWQPSQGVYLRRVNEDQCWVASGQVRPVTDIKRWMDTKMVSVSATDLASVAITGDANWTLQRADADSDWTLAEALPDGRVLAEGNPFVALTGSLSWTSFDNVEPSSAERYQVPAERTIVFKTFDGKETTLQLWRDDQGCWVRCTQEGLDALADWGYHFPSSKADIWFQGIEDWLEPLPEPEPESESEPESDGTSSQEGADGSQPPTEGSGG